LYADGKRRLYVEGEVEDNLDFDRFRQDVEAAKKANQKVIIVAGLFSLTLIARLSPLTVHVPVMVHVRPNVREKRFVAREEKRGSLSRQEIKDRFTQSGRALERVSHRFRLTTHLLIDMNQAVDFDAIVAARSKARQGDEKTPSGAAGVSPADKGGVDESRTDDEKDERLSGRNFFGLWLLTILLGTFLGGAIVVAFFAIFSFFSDVDDQSDPSTQDSKEVSKIDLNKLKRWLDASDALKKIAEEDSVTLNKLTRFLSHEGKDIRAQALEIILKKNIPFSEELAKEHLKSNDFLIQVRLIDIAKAQKLRLTARNFKVALNHENSTLRYMAVGLIDEGNLPFEKEDILPRLKDKDSYVLNQALKIFHKNNTPLTFHELETAIPGLSHLASEIFFKIMRTQKMRPTPKAISALLGHDDVIVVSEFLDFLEEEEIKPSPQELTKLLSNPNPTIVSKALRLALALGIVPDGQAVIRLLSHSDKYVAWPALKLVHRNGYKVSMNDLKSALNVNQRRAGILVNSLVLRIIVDQGIKADFEFIKPFFQDIFTNEEAANVIIALKLPATRDFLTPYFYSNTSLFVFNALRVADALNRKLTQDDFNVLFLNDSFYIVDFAAKVARDQGMSTLDILKTRINIPDNRKSLGDFNLHELAKIASEQVGFEGILADEIISRIKQDRQANKQIVPEEIEEMKRPLLHFLEDHADYLATLSADKQLRLAQKVLDVISKMTMW